MMDTSGSGTVGVLLKQRRERRRMSQLSLAVEAEISSRHLSFVETGRSHPSREMVLLLAEVLDLPPRARNDLLAAAGYAPIYRESSLDAPEMAPFPRALDFIMLQQEPFPAVALDRYWNILLANQGDERFLGIFLDEADTVLLGPPNPRSSSVTPKPCGPISGIGKSPRLP